MIKDEILMAYADGELDPMQRASVEQAAKRDPATAKRLADHVALRARMSKAFAGVLNDPVPSRLSDLAGGADPPGATVIDFAGARAARAPKPRYYWPVGGAMAACLTVGLLVGAGFQTLRVDPMVTGADGAMVAQGSLARALSDQLAANQTQDRPIKVGLSFRTASGDYCRTFRIDRGAAVAGLACRDPAAWSIKMAVATPPERPSLGYRTASSAIPPAVLQLVETLGAGEPLDAKAEAQAQARGWRK